MRGGVSFILTFLKYPHQSSPHAWGCFRYLPGFQPARSVFPTCVGVFPSSSPPWRRRASLPHMRGGVSKTPANGISLEWSSPHAWGCFLFHSLRWLDLRVFPTCVGVFLFERHRRLLAFSLPHMREGVSIGCGAWTIGKGPSPHAWECFRLSSDDKSRLCAFLR